MSYRSEQQEMRETIPTFVEFHTWKGMEADLPGGYMIEQDGQYFRPRYFVDQNGTYDHIRGWMYFYSGRSSYTFASFEEAQTFMLEWVAFLEWCGRFASTSRGKTSHEMLEQIDNYSKQINAAKGELAGVEAMLSLAWRENKADFEHYTKAEIVQEAQDRSIKIGGHPAGASHHKDVLVAAVRAAIGERIQYLQGRVECLNEFLVRLQAERDTVQWKEIRLYERAMQAYHAGLTELDPVYQSALQEKIQQILPPVSAWRCYPAGSAGGVDIVCYKDEREWECWYQFHVFNEQALARLSPSIQQAISEWQRGQQSRQEARL